MIYIYLDVSTSPYEIYQKGNPYDLFWKKKQVKYFYMEIMIIYIRKLIYVHGYNEGPNWVDHESNSCCIWILAAFFILIPEERFSFFLWADMK